MKTLKEYSQIQIHFIGRKASHLMSVWCEDCIDRDGEYCFMYNPTGREAVYIEFAIANNWISEMPETTGFGSNRGYYTILTEGWVVGASSLTK